MNQRWLHCLVATALLLGVAGWFWLAATMGHPDPAPDLPFVDDGLSIGRCARAHMCEYLFGIPTAARRGNAQQRYLEATLDSVFHPPSPYPFAVRVLLLHPSGEGEGRRLRRSLPSRFSALLDSGRLLLTTVRDPHRWYPAALRSESAEACALSRGSGDAMAWVKWRSRLCMDAAFLMAAAAAVQPPFDYYVHLEDDTPVIFPRSLALIHARVIPQLPGDALFLALRRDDAAIHLHDASASQSDSGLDPLFLPFSLNDHLSGAYGFLISPHALLPLSQHVVVNYDRLPLVRQHPVLSFISFPHLFLNRTF
ncbi:MAG: hypothetical protein Q8P67_07925 [archaeon]|nr:hypothetical protein [archaeon]